MDAVTQALTTGFAGEAQSYLRYILFSEKAEVDMALASTAELTALLGEAADTFRRLAEQERRHAIIYLEALAGLRDTSDNVAVAIDGEIGDIAAYAGAAAAARMDKQEKVAAVFGSVAAVEQRHEEELRVLSGRLQASQLAGRLSSS